MKKTILFLFLFVLASFLVTAQGGNSNQGGNGIHEPGTGLENPELRATNQGTGQGLQNTMDTRMRFQAGEHMNEQGKRMRLMNSNGCRLEVEGVTAECPNDLEQEKIQNRTRLSKKLSNGRNAEIKVMPNTASERALERLRLVNCNEDCTIELKEVGSGEQTRAAYNVRAKKQMKFLGLFKANADVEAEVDAETGEVIRSKRPWWAALSTEA